MKRSELGSSGVSISRVVFGSMGHGQRTPSEQIAALHAALDAGVTSIDTAPLYEFGEVERTVGRAIRDRREQVEVLSKVGLRWDDAHGDVLFEFNDATGARRKVRRDSRPAALRKDVEESLQRLGTEHIDLCQIHHPDPHVPIADSVGELNRLAREGKIGAIGVSNFTPPQISATVAALADDPTGVRLASDQLEYNLLKRSPEIEIVPQALRHGFGLLAYSPLDAGSLAGKTLDSKGDPSSGRGGRASFLPTNAAKINAALRDCLLPIARQHNESLAAVSLAWLLARPGVSGVVVGASTPDQAIANTRACEIALTPEELVAIEKRFAEVKIDASIGLSFGARARKLVFRARRKLRRMTNSH